MSQSKFQSFIESNLNTVFGFVLSMATMHWVIPLVFPELKPHTGWSNSFAIVSIFTTISVVRNYTIRRIFNKLGENKNVQRS